MSSKEYRKSLRTFYTLLSRAREATAGCCVMEIPEVVSRLADAKSFLLDWLSRDEMARLAWGRSFETEIIKVEKLLWAVKVYGDRLEPDRILCDVLNRILEHERNCAI